MGCLGKSSRIRMNRSPSGGSDPWREQVAVLPGELVAGRHEQGHRSLLGVGLQAEFIDGGSQQLRGVLESPMETFNSRIFSGSIVVLFQEPGGHLAGGGQARPFDAQHQAQRRP